MAEDNHYVSIVIPTTGRSSLDRCLEALKAQTRPGNEHVIVEDTERRGASWTRNRGICQAEGDLIAFIDDDCIAPPDWLERLVNAIDTFNAAGAGGTMVDVDPFLSTVRARQKFPAEERLDLQGIVGNTANIIFKREWLERCKAEDGFIFNESFGTYGSEDHELVLRIRSRGGTMAYVPNPVRHERKVTLPYYLKYTFKRGIGIAFLHETHRKYGKNIQQQESILWSGQKYLMQRVLEIFHKKIIGPLDVTSFPNIKYFLTFWLSQKYQAVGYLWGRLFLVKHVRKSYQTRLP